MAKKISMEELRLKMADPTTTAEQLRGYFRAGEEAGPFAPKLDLKDRPNNN